MVLCGIVSGGMAIGIWILHRFSLWETVKNPYKMLLIFSVLGLLSGIMEKNTEDILENGKLYRNLPGEGTKEAALQVYLPEEDTEYTVRVEIEEKMLTAEEEQEKIQAAIAEIEKSFCGKNPSLENIQDNPVVLETYQNDMVTAEWSFSDACISRTGVIDVQKAGEKRRLVKADIKLACGESEGSYQFYFWIVPKEKNAEERVKADIQKQIAEQAAIAEEVVLPVTADGKKICWKEVRRNKPLKILTIGVMAAIAYAYAAREKKLRKAQKKREMLLMEYPEFVSKLSLLLGSGMHISAAFRKMNQMQQKSRRKKADSVYGELQQMLYEIDNGKGEMRAYQEFAERCNLQPYRKLVSLLQSGQKMGDRELIEHLHEEADRVFAERKNTARKLGEEAGTKLLMPMMLMLVLVMGIVIFPAFLSIYHM